MSRERLRRFRSSNTRRLRIGCGVVELADWSSITVTGADRQTFLNNFCTNDVKRLAPGDSCEAFFTNVKGKIVGHGLVTCREDELVFVGVAGPGREADRASRSLHHSRRRAAARHDGRAELRAGGRRAMTRAKSCRRSTSWHPCANRAFPAIWSAVRSRRSAKWLRAICARFRDAIARSRNRCRRAIAFRRRADRSRHAAVRRRFRRAQPAAGSRPRSARRSASRRAATWARKRSPGSMRWGT